jgi:hypothetical protein
MARPDYVPRTHSGFNTWQRTISEFVTANAAAWNIDAATVTLLTNKSTAFGTLYQSIVNRQTRTLQQVADFNQNRIEFTTFLRQLVQGSLVNNALISYADKIAMGLNPRTGSRSERPIINSMPIISVRAIGGGVMEFTCADSTDGRSARPDIADGVLLQMNINMGAAKPPPNQGLEPQPPIPVDVTELVAISSSRTRVRHAFTEAQRGKTFTIAGRWYNNTDRSKDGPIGSTVSGFVG